MSGPSALPAATRNTAIDDDLDLSDGLNGRVAQILPNAKTYASLVDVVDFFGGASIVPFLGASDVSPRISPWHFPIKEVLRGTHHLARYHTKKVACV